MNRSFLFISIILHIIAFYTLFYFLPKDEVKVEEEKINVSLVTLEQEPIVKQNSREIKQEDVIINKTDVETNIDKPTDNSYIDETLDFIEPDLLVQNREIDNKKEIDSSMNLDEFELDLEEFMPEDILFPEEEKSDDVVIDWSNQRRSIVTNSYIDFSTFPEHSFTGVGARVSFLVNEDGDVFNVKVLPPGSGSVEFDILIEQYVSNFKFNASDQVSEGEIEIVYNK